MSRPDDLDASALAAVVGRAFGTRLPLHLERAPDGTSTPVYRLTRGHEVFYVRAGEHPDHRLGVEVEVHGRLRALGVLVPGVVFHEPFDERLGRSIAILTALPGIAAAGGGGAAPGSAGGDRSQLAAVYRAAGRDLARIESLPVDGFGFVLRDGASWPLRAPHRTASGALLAEVVEGDDPAGAMGDLLLGDLATPSRIRTLEAVVADLRRDVAADRPAVLVHGDVDPAHVFHLDGIYTGLIDLGEIRGGTPGDDLARFRLWGGDGPALAQLTAGYTEIASLGADHQRTSASTAAVMGIQQLSRWEARHGEAARRRPAAQGLVRRVAQLLDTIAR